MRPPPPPPQWGTWNELPEPVSVTCPTPEQDELMSRIAWVRDQHDGWFECKSPEYREWLLRRSWEAVNILQLQLERMTVNV